MIKRILFFTVLISTWNIYAGTTIPPLTGKSTSRNRYQIAADNPPVLAGIEGTALSYTEGDPATAITNTITVSDVDNTTQASGTVSITSGFSSSQDVLSFTNDGSSMGNIAASYDSTTGVLTITSSGAAATLAQWQSALRAVKYQNTSQNPSTSTRTVSFTVSDGSANSNTVTRNISITAVNNNPSATGIPDSISQTEDVQSVAGFSSIVISDPDAGSGEVTIKFSAESGTFVYALGTGITETGMASKNVTFTGTLSDLNFFLSIATNILYTSAQNVNGAGADSITVTLNDNGNTGSGGGTDIVVGTIPVNIAAVNDPPVVGNVDGESSDIFQVIGPQNVALFDNASVSDVDSPDYNGGFLTITQGSGTSNGSWGVDGTTATSGGDATIAAGETIAVGGAAIGTVHATNDGQGGNTLEIDFNSANSTSQNIQTLLRALTYSAPSGIGSRTYTLTLNDGDGTANGGIAQTTVSFTINVTPNPPVISNLNGDDASINVGGTPGNIDVGDNCTVTDADSPNFNGGNLTVTQDSGTANGSFSLTGSGATGVSSGTSTLDADGTISGSEIVFVNGTAIASVSAVSDGQGGNNLIFNFGPNATPARTQTLIRALLYSVPSGAGDRTFTLSITDASTNSATGFANFTISALSPSMDLSQGSTTLADNGNYNFGNEALNSNTDVTFKIINSGTGPLNITTPITLSGTDAGQFSIRQQPSSTVNPSDSTTFIIRFTPASSGSKTAKISIVNNEVSKNPYNLTLNGNGNTPPNLGGIETSALNYTEGDTAKQITSTITVSDTDTVNMDSAAVIITSNYVNGEDVLSYSQVGSITGVFNAATGSMTLSGSDKKANYQLALRAVKYNNTSYNPSTATRRVSFYVNDGIVNSDTLTRDITLTAVNNPLSLTVNPVNPSYNLMDSTSGVSLFTNANVSTFGSGQKVINLTLSVRNVNNGLNEILYVGGSNVPLTNKAFVRTAINNMNVSVSLLDSTATVSISSGSGISTGAMDNLIDGIRYKNTSASPDTLNRVVTIESIQDNWQNKYQLSVSSTVRINGGMLNITSALSGEYIKSGAMEEISWTCQKVNYVRIELSIDNGVSWGTVASGIPASSESYSWDVGKSLSSSYCMIKLVDEADTTLADTSGRFTVYSTEVTLPSVVQLEGSSGGNLPVSVSGLSGQNVTSFKFTLYYDKAVCYITGANADSKTISSVGSLVYTADTAEGKLEVMWVSANALGDSGVLMNLVTHYRNIGTSSLNFGASEGAEGTFMFNAGAPAAYINNGEISVTDRWVNYDTMNAYVGDTVLIPVYTKDITQSDSVTSFGFTSDYDASILKMTGYKTVGAISQGGTASVSVDSTNGKVTLLWTSSSPIMGSGILVYLKALVLKVGTSKMVFDSFQYNNGSPAYAALSGMIKTSIPLYTLGVEVTYPNQRGSSTEVKGVNVTIASGDTAKSGVDGKYEFTDLTRGSYTLTLSYSSQWQSADASDAYDIARYYNGEISLDTLQRLAADVNGDGKINNTDALEIEKRYIGEIDSFAVPDWLFYRQSKNIILSATDTTENISMIEAGDVNESYMPGRVVAKISSPSVMKRGAVVADNSGFEVPVRLNLPAGLAGSNAELGAFSIALKYPKDKVEFKGIETAGGRELFYYDNNGEVRIGWMDNSGGNSPIKVNKGDVLFTLRFEIKDSKNNFNGMQLGVEPGTEIIGTDGKLITNVALVLPDTKKIIPGSYNLSQNYPNPFNPSTTIKYDLPYNSMVRLTLYNILGQQVKQLVNQEQNAGYYKYNWNASEFASGVYICVLNAKSTDGSKSFQSIKKMVLLK